MRTPRLKKGARLGSGTQPLRTMELDAERLIETLVSDILPSLAWIEKRRVCSGGKVSTASVLGW